MSSPNILLIICDQLRADALGCTGGWVHTPHIDKIARRGVTFTNCSTTSPICMPARLSLATGHYPHNHGMWYNSNHAVMPPETPTWMQAIRAKGYRTSLFGKTHLHTNADLPSSEHLLNAYGYDDVDETSGPWASTWIASHMTQRWEAKGLWERYKNDYKQRSGKPPVARPSVLPLEEYADVYVGTQACDYLGKVTTTQPWFCTVSFGGPHEPWDAPEPYASLYDPAAMPPPLPPPKDSGLRPLGYCDELMSRSPKLDYGEIAGLRANYAGNVTLIDDQIGRIMNILEARKQAENTVIALTSDHGEMNGDCGLYGKSNMLRSSVSVPLIISTPLTRSSRFAGSCNDSPVEWIDSGPTLVEEAGGTLEYQQFAKSLSPILAGSSASVRDSAISEIKGEYMFMTREWKMVVNREGQVYQLFRLVDDPNEATNLAGTPECRTTEAHLNSQLLERLTRAKFDNFP